MIHKAITPIIALLLLPFVAHAQARPEFPRSVTAPGIGLPGQSVLFQRHPDAPAAMASLRGVRIGVTGLEYLSGSEDPWNISGESLFAVYPVPLLSMAFGGSIDLLRGDGWSAGRLNAAVGAQFTRTMYWGASYSYVTSPTH